MSGDESGGNKTVFRPSPLQGLRATPPGAAPPSPAQPGGWGPAYTPPPETPPAFAPPVAVPFAPQTAAPAAPLPADDIPRPEQPPHYRNPILMEAAPLLALAASVRSGRAQIGLPQLHGRATAAITAFDQAIRAAGTPDESAQRARYALCATLDDIAQNLPGQPGDGAEWARRSLVVQFFRENIGGDRFWQLLDDMLARPAEYGNLIELYHACLAAGFEGRFRVMPDGKSRLHDIMTRAYAALEPPRTLSQTELVPEWRGRPTPLRKVGFWAPLMLAAAAAAALLLVLYLVLRLVLAQTGQPAMTALRAVNPDQPLRMSRVAPAPPAPPPSGQLQTLRKFLAPEIAQHLVVVEQDPASLRVRTTVGQLFQSGSDQLEPGRKALFERIGAAVETQPGPVKIEGHADSDRVSGVTFPDNFALSKARAEAVAGILRGKLSDSGRVSAAGFGDSRPIASNKTPQGKALNRRVEILVPRSR